MDMDQIGSSLGKSLEDIRQRAEKNKGKEYRHLWVRVSFAVVKDKHIKKIGARAFGVFMVIRAYMDKDGIAYPSLETVAYQSGCSVGTIRKEISRLEQNGWISKDGHVRYKDGRFGNAKYRILERELIRGSGQRGFMDVPVTNCDDGE